MATIDINLKFQLYEFKFIIKSMDLAKLKQTYLVLNCDVWMKVEFNEYPWATMIHPGHGKTAPSWGSESW